MRVNYRKKKSDFEWLVLVKRTSRPIRGTIWNIHYHGEVIIETLSILESSVHTHNTNDLKMFSAFILL